MEASLPDLETPLLRRGPNGSPAGAMPQVQMGTPRHYHFIIYLFTGKYIPYFTFNVENKKSPEKGRTWTPAGTLRFRDRIFKKIGTRLLTVLTDCVTILLEAKVKRSIMKDREPSP